MIPNAVTKRGRRGEGGGPTPFWKIPDKIDRLRAAFSNGATRALACSYANISRSAYYAYIKKNPDKAWEEWERFSGVTAVQCLAVIVDKALNEKNTDLAKWLIERNVKEYAPGYQVRISDAKEEEKIDLPGVLMEAIDKSYGPGSPAERAEREAFEAQKRGTLSADSRPSPRPNSSPYQSIH